MARIAVLDARVPFTRGGADVLVDTLAKELRRREHEVDVVQIPFSVSSPADLLTQVGYWHALDCRKFGGKDVDLVIATKFPTYFARHPRKSVWLVHQHRPAYDLYASDYCDLSDDPRDESLRRTITELDSRSLSSAAFLGGISRTVTDRLKTYLGLNAVPLYPPLSQGTAYRAGPSQPYILAVGRLLGIKRWELLIRALPFIHENIKLKIAGLADDPRVVDFYRGEINKHHLWNRVEFLGRVSDDQLLDLYSHALAVPYVPVLEDYGYVTLEGMASSKPIVTCSDSGGVLEFVRHGETGLVAEPNPESIGKAINTLVENPKLAQELGARGRLVVESLRLMTDGWEPVIAGLLAPLHTPLPGDTDDEKGVETNV